MSIPLNNPFDSCENPTFTPENNGQPVAIANPVIPTLGLSNIPDYSYPAYYNNEFIEVKLSGTMQGKKYVVLVFYPYDFTPVCNSELIKLSGDTAAFARYDATCLFVSVDSKFSHKAWSMLDRDSNGVGELSFPMVSDSLRRLSSQFGVLNTTDQVSKRASVILDASFNIVYFSYTHDAIGRSSDEIFRILAALESNASGVEHCRVDFDPRTD